MTLTTMRSPARTGAETATEETADAVDIVELLFFAYRDFVGEPDRLLARFGFGRAHHRALHFINRRPGMTVAELLGILAITKQSLARVLRDLVAGGFVEQRTGAEDRRQRLLHLTEAGAALAGELLDVQQARVRRALGALDGAERGAVETFLKGLIDSESRGEDAE